MEVDPSSAASTSLAFAVFIREVQEPRMAMGRGGERRNHERHRKPRNHEWTRMDTKKLRNHEWTRMDTKKTQNHEWTRMDTKKTQEPRMDTNGHEWTRMDTNDKDRRNHETHETHEKNSGTTNGHEWIPRRRQGRYRKTPRLLCPGPKSFGNISESAKSGGAGRRSCQEVSQDNDDIRHAHPGDEGGQC